MAAVQLPKNLNPGLISEWPLTRVSTKDFWVDDWTPQDYLQLISCGQAIAPTIPQARLRWHSGEVIHEDGGASHDGNVQSDGYVNEPPQDLRGKYVKIEFLPDGGVTGLNANGNAVSQ